MSLEQSKDDTGMINSFFSVQEENVKEMSMNDVEKAIKRMKQREK